MYALLFAVYLVTKVMIVGGRAVSVGDTHTPCVDEHVHTHTSLVV